MSEDILLQVVSAVKSSPVYSLQLDESTDVASCSQLIVYVRYLDKEGVKDEYLYSEPVATTTRGEDIFKILEAFLLIKHRLSWEALVGLCTVGAPSMIREECRSACLLHSLHDSSLCFGDEDYPTCWTSRSAHRRCEDCEPYPRERNNFKDF